MKFILHQEAIKSLIKFTRNLADQLMNKEAPKAAAPLHLPVAAEGSHGVSGMTAGTSPNPVAKKTSKRPVIIQLSRSRTCTAIFRISVCLECNDESSVALELGGGAKH